MNYVLLLVVCSAYGGWLTSYKEEELLMFACLLGHLLRLMHLDYYYS